MDSSFDEGSHSGPSPNGSMHASPDIGGRQVCKRRVVVFDEKNLATNEVIKEEVRRNMVVKIDEPKTPFHYETNEEADEDEGHELGVFAGCGQAIAAVCPNQLHDILVSVSALQQHASPEHVSSPDCLAGHHSDTSLHSEHSSDSEDIFEAKRKQHYRMGAALKGQAPMGMLLKKATAAAVLPSDSVDDDDDSETDA